TVFSITAGGMLTTLHSFDSTDGAYPYAALIQATNGTFYGTTSEGGTANCSYGLPCGSVFSITSGGTLTTLHSFDSTDGEKPDAALVQDTNGTFYGVTYEGGASNYGTIFSLAVGLPPFVETLPRSGKVGKAVKILGTDLTGAISVTFNSTAATFTVASKSEITTTVPAGATTGEVKVVTSNGTLTSNVLFRVTPQFTSLTPASGPVETIVTITGVSLTQTTKVTFGGVKATTFTVNSDTQVTATVPTSAETGKIAITTAGGAATSATVFTLIP
ncbi:MAG: choice-of-anchor tandem repeat GloVer-containing protein, partial [Candidatus Sulfotelmatobacter sp.]